MFHRTHRPQDFNEISGKMNKVTAKVIKGFIDDGTLNHTLLFTGIRGVGKTTMGRLIANALGCVDDNINVFELNTADDRGINKARAIIGDANYTPRIGNKKVFIFDECHQVTHDFSEAVLKITEDTPDHVYFILCTSKPEELDGALKSRCQHYHMEQCNSREIGNLLNKVCKAEGLDVPRKVINYIAANTDGVPREALVSLHKIMNLDEEEALLLLNQNKVEDEVFQNLVTALRKRRPWKTTSKLVKKCLKNPEQTRYGVLSYVSTCILNGDKVDPQLMLIWDAFSQTFKPMGKDGHNGLVFACASCLE